ncbi:hypothetical protein PR048_013306 [Dryococelus australis]|uniref:Reverse transcriptase Ty1/copia-type domain-containing protein n=1 Tax=Dryococelus australis TaxID=614101 RepID=A0ABQ9HSM5_9NEOP|nr:hypothetical protein PR048_013306 [Dryococelus australis]
MKDSNPQTYQEAVSQSEDWRITIQRELDAHKKFHICIKVDSPKNVKSIEKRWLFSNKPNGTKKAPLVVKGFQKNTPEDNKGLVYAPVAKIATIRVAISYSLQKDWTVKQMDIPTVFLNGIIENDVYVFQPEVIEKKRYNNSNMPYMNLRKAPRCWNKRFNQFADENRLRRSRVNICLYIGTDARSQRQRNWLNGSRDKFGVKDIEDIQCFVRTEVKRVGTRVELCQCKLIEKMLEWFNVEECETCPTPMEDRINVRDTDAVVDVPF